MNEDAGLLETHNMPLMGVNFRPAETKEVVMNLTIGQRLFLEREPSNEYDPNAVRVKDEDGNFLGYIARTNNFEVAMHLDSDLPYRCTVIGFLSTLKPDLEVKLFEVVDAEADGGSDAE